MIPKWASWDTRYVESTQSAILCVLGLWLILFDINRTFSFLPHMPFQAFWGVFYIATGVARATSIYISNIAVRLLTAYLSAFIFMSLTILFIQADYTSIAVPLILTITINSFLIYLTLVLQRRLSK